MAFLFCRRDAMNFKDWEIEAKRKCDILKVRIKEPQKDIDDYTWHLMHRLLRSYQKDYSILIHMNNS